MFKVEWTDEAEQDLENILTYYFEEAGVHVVNEIFVRIQEQVGLLKHFHRDAGQAACQAQRNMSCTACRTSPWC